MMPPGQYSLRNNVPPQPQQTAQQAADQPSSRSAFGQMSHSNNNAPGSKMPPSMMNSGSQPPSHLYGSQYQPTGGTYGSSSGPSAHHHHHHHHHSGVSGQLMRSQRGNELPQQQAPQSMAIFPPNSIEATVPIPSKRRKLMARDIGPVDAWRVYMALKSGLLAESTYALDVLNVISNDDISLLFLSLPNMPGLLDVLLEHYRRYLNEMFDSMFDDIEIGYEDRQKQEKRMVANGNQNGESKSSMTNDDDDHHSNKLKWYELDRDRKDEQNNLLLNEDDDDIEQFLDREFKLNGRPKLTLFQDQTNNYTNVTRNGKTVKVKKDKNLFIIDYDKRWDPSGNGFSTRHEHWQKGGDFEDESYDQEEPAVCTGREYQDSIKSRCLTVSNLIRNLTFVPGNDIEMCRSSCLLLILSRLILLHHVHALKKKRKISEIDCTKIVANRLDEETMFNLIDEKSDSSDGKTDKTDCMMDTEPEKEWWWEALHLIRENTMVTLANISGHLDLSTFPESITLALLDGLLHWAICPSSYAQDAFPSAPNTLSPRRLAYEALSKLSIYESNVDLILATPPWSRIEKFLKNLTRSLVRNEDQTVREFSIVLISNFVTADPSVVRVIALSGFSVSLLLGFIEQAEQSALSIANAHGIQYLRENFDAIGTTPDMVRRAATILRTLARYSENRSLFIQHEQRLLSLSMSQILDTSISSIIADILYECSFETIINNNNNNHNVTKELLTQ
ncbi:AT-rich interactive domain-containing 3A-like protein [Euroglyphus maynei]|uniref:AT-rich interactive domain-containing 3A-like protein n=1 Tax=Euroglyphus maynei TaxID=6958 RepID=A0A1Y3AT21_EURMA|nr:AT-rich interactive domain-containing 3A-like protein [Euroglyphus maynei]